LEQGTLTERGRLNTVDLLKKITCFGNDMFPILRYAKYQVFGTRRSTVLILSLKDSLVGVN
jgi:hypothetical protein